MSSFMVIGMGRFGSSVALELFALGHEVFVIDENEEIISKIADSVSNAIIGDAKDEAVLSSAGIKNFDCVVVSMAERIEDSILITLLLKELGAKKIVCKAQNERHAKALTLIGADKIVRPEFDMGKRVAHSLTKQNIIEFIELSPDYSIAEIKTPTQWIDKSIVTNNLRRKYGITVLAIRKDNSKDLRISPNAEVILVADDILVVIGLTKDVEIITRLK